MFHFANRTIGTYDKDGRANAMNAAWGGQWDKNEIMVSAKNEPSKMEKTGWTVIPSENVKAPVFTDFPMTL